MRFEQQVIDIPVRNIENSFTNITNETKRHSNLLPNSIRCIIAGPSNCGKTNLLISLIESEHGLKFENIYLYSKTLEQSKYKYLKSLLTPIKNVGFHMFSSIDKVISPHETKKNSIVIFDDVICDKNQENIRNLFCLGRHRNLDVFYLTQTYTKVGKHLIRDNCNFLILFKQDEMNMKHVFNDMGVSSDLNFKDFQQLCRECWKDKYGFVIIDLDSNVNSGRYRRGFSEYLKV